MFFSCSCLLFYRSYVLLCKRDITPSRYYLLKVTIQYINDAFQEHSTIKAYEIEVIMLPTQPPVRMALPFNSSKQSHPPPLSTHLFSEISLMVMGSFAKYTHNYQCLLQQVPLMAKHLLDSAIITILAADSLDAERTEPSSNFLQISPFYSNISVLAAISHDAYCTAPSTTFF